MPVVQACVLTFTNRVGTGTQTITGVVDEDGDPFIAKVVIFQSGFVALNTVRSGTAGVNAFETSIGVDTGAVRSAISVPDVYSSLNFKAAAGAVSFGDHSHIEGYVSNFSQITFRTQAKVSDVRSGEIDLLYALNDSGAEYTIQMLALGGDGLDILFTNYTVGSYATPSKPQGLLGVPLSLPQSSGATTWGTGGQNVCWGFATRDGNYGTSNLNVVLQGNNWIVQRTDAWNCAIDQTDGTQSGLSTISAWGDLAFSIGTNGGGTATPLVFCGDEVVTAGGAITEGTTIINTGIRARAVLFFSVGQPQSDATGSPVGQLVTGWATPTSQVGYWTGEKLNGNTGPIFGARYAADDSVFRAGTPAAGSTTFDAIAEVVSIDTLGIVTLNWPSSDSGDRQVLWFAIGEQFAPPPPPPEPVFRTREVVRRRLRRAPIVWSEKNGLQTRVRINLFAVDMQPGVGTADTPNPLVMIRASKDGGFTWSNERMISAGRVGEYFERINAWRWGSGRDWVFEVACTDPVTWNLLGAYLDAEPGQS